MLLAHVHALFALGSSIGRGSYGERLQRSAPWRRVTPGRFDSSVHGVNLGTHTLHIIIYINQFLGMEYRPQLLSLIVTTTTSTTTHRKINKLCESYPEKNHTTTSSSNYNVSVLQYCRP